MDYAYSFWHVDCVRKAGLKTFTERYQNFCKKHHYNFQPDKPIQQSIQQLNLACAHMEKLRQEMDTLASTLPEYTTIMNIYGH